MYSGVFGNMIDDYQAELGSLNQKYIHNALRIQKKFLSPEQTSRYLENYYHDLEQINSMLQKVRESPKHLEQSS